MSTDLSPGVSPHDEEAEKDAQFARLLSGQHQELNRRYKVNHQLAAYTLADMMREKGVAELHLSDAGSDGAYFISGGLTDKGVVFNEADEQDIESFENELYATFSRDDLEDVVEAETPAAADWLIKAKEYSDAAALADLRRQRDEVLSEITR